MFGNCYFIWSAKITPGPGPEVKICARESERDTSRGREMEEFRRLLRRVLRQLPPPAGPVYTKDIKRTISRITRTQMSWKEDRLSLNSKVVNFALFWLDFAENICSPTTISVGEKNNLNNISVRKYIVCKQIPPSRVSLPAMMDKWARQNSLSPVWLLLPVRYTLANCTFHSNFKHKVLLWTAWIFK